MWSSTLASEAWRRLRRGRHIVIRQPGREIQFFFFWKRFAYVIESSLFLQHEDCCWFIIPEKPCQCIAALSTHAVQVASCQCAP
jgi:hypothetical protein